MFEEFEELGSIVKFFYENHNKKDKIKLYFEEVEKEFQEPCIYFPTPLISQDNFTTTSFKNSYTWFIKLFDKSSYEAQISAMKLSNSIANNKYKIPILNYDGTKTNRYVTIKNMETRKIGEGTIEVTIVFDLCYFYSENYQKFVNFFVNKNIKEG